MTDLRNIVLVGFMGAGKTVVGKELASVLHRPFFDTDVIVEETAGAAVEAIFDALGEAAFRDLESQAIAGIASIRGAVIATGGGALQKQENVANLKQNSFVVYLAASAAELLERISGGTGRPLAEGLQNVEDLGSLLAGREPIYRQMADLVVDTTGKPLEDVRHEIFQAIGY